MVKFGFPESSLSEMLCQFTFDWSHNSHLKWSIKLDIEQWNNKDRSSPL